MNSALIFCALAGFVMVVVSLAWIVPELAMDSSLELLLSLVSCRGENIFTLAHTHIQEGWPETKVLGFLYYGGVACLLGVAAVVAVRIYLSETS